MSHTPGPWTAGYRALDVRACDGQMKICDIRGWGYLTGGAALNLDNDKAIAIQTANANLIAAAPTLLEALEEWLVAVGPSAVACARQKAVAAVNAATGGQQ